MSERAEVRPKREQSLVLKVQLTPSRFLGNRQEVGVHLSTTVLQYHGSHFEWTQSEVIQSISKNLRVSKQSKKVDETLLLSFPTVGNYLIRLESHLHQVDTMRNRQYGVETKRFVKVKVD